MAAVTRKALSLCWDKGQVVDFSSSNYAEFRAGETTKHTTKSSTCIKGSRVGPTTRTYNDADRGVVRPAAADAEIFFSRNQNVTDTYDRVLLIPLQYI